MRRFLKRIGAMVLALWLVIAVIPVRADASGYYSRISGENRFETAFRVADAMRQELMIEKFQAVIIASGTSFADALSGSYLANVKAAPILLSYNDTYNKMVKDYIHANLAPGGTVYILGGTAAVPESMAQGLEGFSVRRLAGADRFETNLLILKEAGVPEGKKVLVCTGTNFADSLSASATGLPILLVHNESGKLTEGQREYLATLRNEYMLIGGESAVSDRMGSLLMAYGYTTRLSGENRFETSVKVAQRFFGQPEKVVLAYAWNYPDGLCGGPLAYVMGCPLVLTMTGYEDRADWYTQSYYIKNGLVLGSSRLISDNTAQIIFTNAKPGNEYRPGNDLGGARRMEGSPYVLALFVDDNESSWDSASVSHVWNHKILPGLSYLEEQALLWGVELDFRHDCWYTGMSSAVTVKYNGRIYDNLIKNTGETYSWDVLDQISLSLGFENQESLDQYIRSDTGATDVLYLVIANKDGRSYAISDSYNNADDTLEYAMLYAYGMDYAYEERAGAVAHEILHIFGAEDYYCESGDRNSERAKLAQQLYPRDIMLTVAWDISDNTLGDFTAYCVGWTDSVPSVCYDLNWWN